VLRYGIYSEVMKALTIGRLAKKCGVNVETIRYYHRRGLLPLSPKTSTYRQYSESDVERLRFIKGAQSLGFTLNEIAELLSLRVDAATSASEVKRRTALKIADIEEKIQSLQEMKTALVSLDQRCKGAESESTCPILESFGRFGISGSCCQDSESS